MDNPINVSQYGDKRYSLRPVAILSYGVVAYIIGVAGLGLLVLGMANILPLGHILPITESNSISIAINTLLTMLFGMQHSVMARPSFKRKLLAKFPAAIERSTFILASGVTLAAIVCLWQPVRGHFWQVTGHSEIVVWGAFVFGWVYLLASTFAINHWDIFGLRQVWLAANNVEYTEVEFVERWMYKYSRHPMMLGVLIGLWFVPLMSSTQFMMAAAMSAYIVVGLYFEERDLIRQWGNQYSEYKKQVGSLLSLPKF